MQLKTKVCKCGRPFYLPKQRGRPPLDCYECRGVVNPYQHIPLPKVTEEPKPPAIQKPQIKQKGFIPITQTYANGNPLDGVALAEHLDMVLRERGVHISQHPYTISYQSSTEP